MTDRKLLEKLDEKMDKVQEHLGSIDVTLAKNTTSLEEHIRRTELAEEAIGTIKDELKPIQKHVTQVHTVFSAIGFISVVVSIAAGIVKVAEFLFQSSQRTKFPSAAPAVVKSRMSMIITSSG